jgi:hypothetical protein
MSTRLPSSLLLSLLVAAAAATASGCAAPAAYDAALAHYKSAVERAKRRLRLGNNSCDVDGTMQSEIARDLAQAVATCGAFRETIATSPWAKPVREALDDNLALPLLTGELKVRDADGRVTWRGLEEALGGKVIYGPSPGVYGPLSKVSFSEDGRAVVHTLQTDEEQEGPFYQAENAMWDVGAIGADGSIRVNVTGWYGTGLQMSFDVFETEDAMELRFQPVDDDATHNAHWSMPDECSA